MTEKEFSPKQIIESLLMVAEEPLSVEALKIVLNSFENAPITSYEIKAIVAELIYEYKNRAFELKEVASGWRFQIKPQFSPWINKLYEQKPLKYSRALLETLAIIAYKQPITRAEIEDIRGVSVNSHTIKTLIDNEWINIEGHKEIPGRPAIFATTKKFLDNFNLKSLDALPKLPDLQEC